MTEREFYISIIPDVAKLVVYLKNTSKEEREQIKEETINACSERPGALRFMRKLWIVMEKQL